MKSKIRPEEKEPTSRPVTDGGGRGDTWTPTGTPIYDKDGNQIGYIGPEPQWPA